MHAHLYFPTRSLESGSDQERPAFGPKLKVFVNQTSGAAFIERMNEEWAKLSNLIAAQSALNARFEHRSYEWLGLTRKVEPKLGQSATALERRGVSTRRGDELRAHRHAREGRPSDVAPLASASASVPFPGPQPAERIVFPGGLSSVQPNRPPEAKPVAVPVTQRPTVAVRRARMLTLEDRAQSPVSWEPPPMVGLAARFEVTYAARLASTQAVASVKVLLLVKAIERALNALVTVAKALLHLDKEYKRYSTARLDVQWNAEQKRNACNALRQEAQAARRPYTLRMTAVHRKRLAQIQTLEEEVADRFRLCTSIEEQLESIAQRAKPWRHQAIEDRRLLKDRLALLETEDHHAVEQLLDIANTDEGPWLRLYSARSEPTLPLSRYLKTAVRTD